MNVLESIPENLATSEQLPAPWAESGGVYWLNHPGLNIREIARAMNSLRARFITITAYQENGSDALRLEYHWDLAGRLLGFTFPLAAKAIESIYDLCEAVDWIEREVHEGFAVDFTGRVYEPLLLREGNTCGVNLREEVAK